MKLTSTISDLQNQNTILKKTIIELETRLSKVNSQLDQNNGMIQELSHTIDSTQRENTELRDQVHKLDENIVTLNTDLAESRLQEDQLSQDKQDQYEEMNSVIIAQKRRIDDLNEIVQTLQTELSEAGELYNKIILEHDEQASRSVDRIGELNRTITALQNELTKSDSVRNRLVKDSYDQQQKIRQLEDKIKELEPSNA